MLIFVLNKSFFFLMSLVEVRNSSALITDVSPIKSKGKWQEDDEEKGLS
jgi:hypothetical protein